MPPDPDRPQRVTLPTLQILAAFMADLSRDDWYGRALSVHTGLGSGTVLQCLYRLENWGWLESRWEDRDLATRDGRPPRRFYVLTGVGQREARALRAGRRFGGVNWRRDRRELRRADVLAFAEEISLFAARYPLDCPDMNLVLLQ